MCRTGCRTGRLVEVNYSDGVDLFCDSRVRAPEPRYDDIRVTSEVRMGEDQSGALVNMNG